MQLKQFYGHLEQSPSLKKVPSAQTVHSFTLSAVHRIQLSGAHWKQVLFANAYPEGHTVHGEVGEHCAEGSQVLLTLLKTYPKRQEVQNVPFIEEQVAQGALHIAIHDFVMFISYPAGHSKQKSFVQRMQLSGQGEQVP